MTTATRRIRIPFHDATVAPTRAAIAPTRRERIFLSRDRKGVATKALNLHPASAALVAVFTLLGGCKVGPNYKQPPVPNPPAFKETPPPNFKEAEAQGWKQSEPGDAYLKGKWWEVYNDPALNTLEEQVSISNQNVLAAEATYREAKAAVTVARAGLLPTVTTTPAITTTSIGKNAAGTTTAASAGAVTRSTFNLPVAASWEPDLWGSIRRGITAASETAQASAGDLENAKLLYQSELAQDYFGLRGNDAEADLLTRTEASYEEYLTLTRNRFNGGVASDLDVAQAESQLYAVQSQLIDLGVQRAQYEHAIAMLTGKAPVEVAIPAEASMKPPPPVPIGVPSELLQRRPDIAAAERRVAAANEQIGIAIAAFYPTLTLNGSVGLEAGSLLKWFTWPARVWSVGPQLAETLFDAGRRRGVVTEQRAAYDATVATYRGTVLTAFQQVEDNLAALRILEGESAKEQETIQSANRALTVSTAQYTAGTVNYLTVITAQATLLTAQVTAVNVLTRRLTASVVLIQALGGGWNTSDLPSTQTVAASTPAANTPLK
jgi:NodT family efflux transporter outer membrane factor (OMF) lipoprotein